MSWYSEAAKSPTVPVRREAVRRRGAAMLFLFFFILGLVIGAIHLLRDKQPRTAGHVAEVLLLWLLVITIGVGGLFTFLAHTVWADSTAVSIGWPTGNPFQPPSFTGVEVSGRHAGA